MIFEFSRKNQNSSNIDVVILLYEFSRLILRIWISVVSRGWLGYKCSSDLLGLIMPGSVLQDHRRLQGPDRKRMVGPRPPIQSPKQFFQSQSRLRIHSDVFTISGRSPSNSPSVSYGVWIQSVLLEIFGISSCFLSVSHVSLWLRISKKSSGTY